MSILYSARADQSIDVLGLSLTYDELFHILKVNEIF